MNTDWDQVRADRRRGALRGLSALPLPRELGKEPTPAGSSAFWVRSGPPNGASARTTPISTQLLTRPGAGRRDDDRRPVPAIATPAPPSATSVTAVFEPVDELVAASPDRGSPGRGRRMRVAIRTLQRGATGISPVTLPILDGRRARTSRPSRRGRLVRTRRELNGELTVIAAISTAGCCGSASRCATLYRRTGCRQGRMRSRCRSSAPTDRQCCGW